MKKHPHVSVPRDERPPLPDAEAQRLILAAIADLESQVSILRRALEHPGSRETCRHLWQRIPDTFEEYQRLSQYAGFP